jgi:Lipase (class 3)
MRTNFRAGFLGLMAIAASMLATGQLAVAQSHGGQDILAAYVYKYAQYYVPYAIQAAVAYQPINELNDRRGKWNEKGYGADADYAVQSAVPGPHEELREHAREVFKRWRYQFGSDSYLTCVDPSDSACQAAFLKRGWDFGSGPVFQVWSRTRSLKAERDVCNEVSIAFRGTVGLSGGDWFSNLNRFGSPYDDYYHQLRRNVDGIIKLIQNLDCYKRAGSRVRIVSTGHSLGGGLAQFVALATRSGGPQIAKVFAFDPSPVTGAHLVDKQLRDDNARGLTVDRVYESGEILSYARDIVQQYPPATSRCDPLVRTVEVKAARGTAVGLHGIPLLATNLVDLSYSDGDPTTYRTPDTQVNGCKVRYLPPDDEELIAAGAPRQRAVSVARSYGRNATRLAGSYSGNAQRYGSIAKPGMRKLSMMSDARVDRIAGLNAYALAAREGTPAFTPLPRAE